MAHPTYKVAYRNSWALVIGIDAYHHVSPLGFAASDAQAIAKLLEEQFAFDPARISLLLNDGATIETIRSRFLSYTTDVVDTDDRIVVFFAGHGHTVRGNRGDVGFLVPVDGRPDDLNTLVRWDELTRNADLISAKHILFLMDACYGGLALVRGPSMGSMRFMGDMLRRHARQVLTAGKADETVADGSGVRPGHSIFTAHLLDALEGKAATEEGLITANGVMAYVYDHVGRDQYSHQTPHFGFIDGDGDFIFNVGRLNELRQSGRPEASGEPDDREDVLVNAAPVIVAAAEAQPVVVERVKELLGDASKRIQLDDFVTLHIRRFLDATDLRQFSVQGSAASKEEIAERIKRYEELLVDLQQIVVLLATWGEGQQLLRLEKIFVRLAESDKGGSGLRVWLALSWYPVIYLMYSAGIAALAARNYTALATLLHTPVTDERVYRGRQKALVVAATDGASEMQEYFKLLPGHERHFVPRSEYLFTALQPTLEDLLLLGKRYEPLFDEFEVLVALEYADLTDREWGPLGRFAWKYRHDTGDNPFKVVADTAERQNDNWSPLKAGFFSGSPDNLTKDVEALKQLMRRLPWL